MELLPPSWQYPEVTCARIIFEEKEYRSSGFKETGYKQSADIIITGKKVGVVEVCYTRKMPPADEGPFLHEERALIDAVVERLGRTAKRMRMEDELRGAYAELQVERKALQESNAALRTVLSRIEDEKGAIKEAIMANVDKIIMPILHALESEVAPERKGYIRLLRRNLEEITSPLVNRLSRRFSEADTGGTQDMQHDPNGPQHQRDRPHSARIPRHGESSTGEHSPEARNHGEKRQPGDLSSDLQRRGSSDGSDGTLRTGRPDGRFCSTPESVEESTWNKS